MFQTVNDTVLEVREASFEALGMAMKVVTEKNIMAYMADVDALKMARVSNRRVFIQQFHEMTTPP